MARDSRSEVVAATPSANEVYITIQIFNSMVNSDNYHQLELSFGLKTTIETKMENIHCCSFSNDDAMVLYTCAGGGVYLHHARTGELVQKLDLRNSDVKSMIVVPGTVLDSSWAFRNRFARVVKNHLNRFTNVVVFVVDFSLELRDQLNRDMVSEGNTFFS